MLKKIGTMEAILSLIPTARFGIYSTPENGDTINSEEPVLESDRPSKAEIDAKIAELKLAEPMRVMREQRDQSLKETDVYMVTDHPTSKADEWKTYRQELRDMPSKETPLLQPDGSLSNVTWPTKPE